MSELAPIPDLVLAVCGVVSFVGMLGILKVLSAWVSQERGVHDLRVRAHRLRIELDRRMAEQHGWIDGGVDILDDDGEVVEAAELVVDDAADSIGSAGPAPDASVGAEAARAKAA
jgi:hypothetical protein